MWYPVYKHSSFLPLQRGTLALPCSRPWLGMAHGVAELTCAFAASFSSFLSSGWGVGGAGGIAEGGMGRSASTYLLSVVTVLFCEVRKVLNSCPPEHLPSCPAWTTVFTILNTVLTWPGVIAEVLRISVLQTHCHLQFLEHSCRLSFQPELCFSVSLAHSYSIP